MYWDTHAHTLEIRVSTPRLISCRDADGGQKTMIVFHWSGCYCWWRRRTRGGGRGGGAGGGLDEQETDDNEEEGLQAGPGNCTWFQPPILLQSEAAGCSHVPTWSLPDRKWSRHTATQLTADVHTVKSPSSLSPLTSPQRQQETDTFLCYPLLSQHRFWPKRGNLLFLTNLFWAKSFIILTKCATCRNTLGLFPWLRQKIFRMEERI